jgi:hypothetical protein
VEELLARQQRTIEDLLRQNHRRSRRDDTESSSADDDAATDEDSDAACFASLERRRKRESTIPKEERFATTLLCSEVSRDAFVSSWRTKLTATQPTGQRDKEHLEQLLRQLLASYDNIVALRPMASANAIPLYRVVKAHKLVLHEAMRTILRGQHVWGHVINSVATKFDEMDRGKKFFTFNQILDKVSKIKPPPEWRRGGGGRRNPRLCCKSKHSA